MTKEWSHLPNAKQIDWVIDTLKKKPEVWSAAWDAAWDAARNSMLDAPWWTYVKKAEFYAARDAANEAAWDTVQDASRVAVWGAALNAARDSILDAVLSAELESAKSAAWDAISALIAWDDSSELLTMPIMRVEELRRSGMPAAKLLLYAIIVKSKLYH
jgi:hypothetical protein